MEVVKNFIILIRPKQWTKNFVVLAGLVFSISFFDLSLVSRTLIAFLVFCLASGVVYIFNDLQDIARDRCHPYKKNRPLAAGKITAGQARIGAILLLLITISISFYLSIHFMLILICFLILNILYTIGLKNIVIVDVLIVAASFVLRAIAGGIVISVEISSWLLVVTTLLALFLGLSKRRHELINLSNKALTHREVLNKYSPELLDQYLNIVAATTIMAYSLYTFTSHTGNKNNCLMLTIPFVIYGVFRYLYLVYKKNLGGTPELILLTDKPLIIVILLWSITIGIILLTN